METVVLENEHVKVTKITIEPGETHMPSAAREDRVVVFLNDHSRHRHHKDGDELDVSRAAGGVAWRDASEDHMITNSGTTTIETLVVEIKNE